MSGRERCESVQAFVASQLCSVCTSIVPVKAYCVTMELFCTAEELEAHIQKTTFQTRQLDETIEKS